MSIDHSHEVGSDENCKLCLNFSGLNENLIDVDGLAATLYAYDCNTGIPKFTCRLLIDDLIRLYWRLNKYSIIRDSEVKDSSRFVELTSNTEELLSLLVNADISNLVPALTNIVRNKLSHEDVNTILGRKDSLQEFESLLAQGDGISEPEWQKFFENNEWIFGYGLKYRFLKILQREAHVSRADIDGTNGVISDFLVSDLKFTKLVELKKPTTPLFANRKNRSDSWCLSNDLSDAVSQILAQKANWEHASLGENYTEDGSKINDLTHDVDCILVIGSRSSISGTDRERAMKFKTLELYRRNMRNIDIVLYDELLERAKFIVRDCAT